MHLLAQDEAGIANGKMLSKACKDGEIVEQTYNRWCKKHSPRADQACTLKELDQDRAKLKRLVSEVSLEKLVLKDIASGNFEALKDGVVRLSMREGRIAQASNWRAAAW